MISRRSFLAAGGVLIVGLGLEGAERVLAQTIPNADRFLGKPLAPDAVDSYLAILVVRPHRLLHRNLPHLLILPFAPDDFSCKSLQPPILPAFQWAATNQCE